MANRTTLFFIFIFVFFVCATKCYGASDEHLTDFHFSENNATAATRQPNSSGWGAFLKMKILELIILKNIVFSQLRHPPAANQTKQNESSINDNSTQVGNDTNKDDQVASTIAKTLKIIGISISGGLLAALFLPAVFLVVLWIVGFTFIGNFVLFFLNLDSRF